MTRENELMADYCHGNNEAFAELATLLLPRLHSYFMSRTHDWHLSEDLTSDTILRIASNKSRYEPRDQFPAWLYRIAERILIGSARAKRIKTIARYEGETEDATARLASDVETPDVIAARNELIRMGNKSLNRIPVDMADTLRRQCQGESLVDIAKSDKTILATVKGRARLAKEKLRLLMPCDAA